MYKYHKSKGENYVTIMNQVNFYLKLSCIHDLKVLI